MESYKVYSIYNQMLFHRLPYLDQSTLGGYCAFLAVQFATGSVYFAVNIATASIFLSLGLFFDAFCIQFELMFRNMSDLVGGRAALGSTVKLKAFLIQAIHFHNQAKKYVDIASTSLFNDVPFSVYLNYPAKR